MKRISDWLLPAGFFLAVVLMLGAIVLFTSTGGTSVGPSGGCYVITTEDNQTIRAIEAPQYNVQTNALHYKLGYGEGWAFHPRQLTLDYRCADITPTATP